MIEARSLFDRHAEPTSSISSLRRVAATVVLAGLCALSACAPQLDVGEWACTPDGVDAAVPDKMAPIALDWSSGFESRFCDYTQLAGFCYTAPLSSYSTVTSPVHSGHYAAAFHVKADDITGIQARCVRQGVLPTDAYYGVWYLVPRAATNSLLWNLVHFQGGDPTGQHGLWDISLINGKNGQLEAVVYDFLSGQTYRAATPVPIPINAWFHLEFRLKRAADATGAMALYQDGQLLVEATNLITDDTSWGQWYVGNYANGLSPADFTLYVDDVTIRGTR